MMENMTPMDYYGHAFYTYGLGLMKNVYPVKHGEDTNVTLRAVNGHYGDDWGSADQLAGYNHGYDFGISVA